MQRGFEKESRKQSKGTFKDKERGCESDNLIEELAWTIKEIGRLSMRHSQDNVH
jgi:hypothetical protein